MAIKRLKNGTFQAWAYDPAQKKKVYCPPVDGKPFTSVRAARAHATEKAIEFRRAFRGEAPTDQTQIATFAKEWLRDYHGPQTRRPAPMTLVQNTSMLKVFLDEFGDRALDGGIGRQEALKWARHHSQQAKAVSAMFNDAVDAELAAGNPFANRRQRQARQRKDIHPATLQEVDLLADIALRVWGDYGLTARAWVLLAAKVGCRPGETFTIELDDLDFENGLVTVRRVKARGNVHPVDVVVLPRAAQDAIRAMVEIPRRGPIFLTTRGHRMEKGSLRYYWDPIRAVFREKVGEQRWQELVRGTERESFDFYALRHHVASMMADRGATAREIAHQLGNSPEVCEETYIHTYTRETNERNRRLLEDPLVVDLDEVRERRGA